ncbi:hypothetical protein A9K97_gp376 [Tokyovirus A1]|uniref:hypothetical protein n=1 Tax=Tokyovirus A1 TaxID=1826170 RepID=UPI0007A98D7D|nr:hypothetical protein A9K97_gp376 [Tokyovirus A1]BAU79975.1 hypothetical protein [Tokyovirus A1]
MFQGGPKITNLGAYVIMDWGPGTPKRYTGPAYVGRSFEAPSCAPPQYVYRDNITRPWLQPSVIEIGRGNIDNIYACNSAYGPINPWDNLAPDRAPCKRPENDGIGSTNWRKWC